MAPIVASSLLGAGTSMISKGLSSLLDRIGGKADDKGAQDKFAIPGKNLPGTGSKDPTSAPQDLFKAMDANRDGSVTRDELKDFVAKQQQAMQAQLIQLQASQSSPVSGNGDVDGTKGPGKAAQDLFKAIDSNSDGNITETELKDFVAKQEKSLQAQLLQIQADHSDRSRDGKGDGGANRADKLFSRLDTDKDGKVSSEELSAYLKKMAEQLRAPTSTPEVELATPSDDKSTKAAA